LTDSAHKYMSMMMELPRKLDGALTQMSEGNALLRLERTKRMERSSQKNSSAVVIALVLLLAAVAVLSHYASAKSVGVWVDEISTVAFLLIGALLLRAAVTGSR